MVRVHAKKSNRDNSSMFATPRTGTTVSVLTTNRTQTWIRSGWSRKERKSSTSLSKMESTEKYQRPRRLAKRAKQPIFAKRIGRAREIALTARTVLLWSRGKRSSGEAQVLAAERRSAHPPHAYFRAPAEWGE